MRAGLQGRAMLLALPFLGLALGIGAAAGSVVEMLPALALAATGITLAGAVRRA